MSTVDTLYVIWQNPDTRRYFPVGRLCAKGVPPEEMYEFVYTRGAESARGQGFEPFLAFPDIGKEYLSIDLFPFFANRLLSTSREDYRDYIEQLGLSPETASPMAILARSGGRRTTDSIELFAPPCRQKSTSGPSQVLEYYFLLHGTGHMKECARLLVESKLQTGEPLLLMHDLQNEVDPKAFVLRTKDYCCIGFVPRFLTEDVWTLLDTGEQVGVTIQQLNPPPAPIQQRVLCKLLAEVRSGFSPCSSNDFQAIVHETKAS